jgi:hypothetical protein
VVDDVLYNIIYDIVLTAHKDEKTARANTAAMMVEQQASIQFAEDDSESSSPTSSPTSSRSQKRYIKTNGAIYDDGNVWIVGNPLETTLDIWCPKCGLPRRLDPPIEGGPAYDPEREYCKRVPYVNRPGYDIYGQPVIQGGKAANGMSKNARKAKENLETAASSQGAEVSSFESPAPSPPKEATKKYQKLVLPDVHCKRCGRDVIVNRFANHLQKCLGIGGRASGRAAALQINGQANGSQKGDTPPISRKGTPLPPEKKSPLKRDADKMDDDDDDWDEDSPKKKKVKKVIGGKKWKSGRITVNGRVLTPGPLGDAKGTQPRIIFQKKENKPSVSEASRATSTSSQTIS